MPEVSNFIAHLSALFDSQGKEIFTNKRNVLKEFVVKKGDSVLERVVVKRYKARNIFQTLAYSTVFSSKAKRAFENGMMLLQCGLSTPEPIAYAEEREGGVLKYGYYLTTFTDAVSVRTELEEKFNHEMAKSFAQFIAKLHDHGLVHHDLNFGNVLYQPKADGSYEISVIDINRMTHKTSKQLTLTDAKDDFVRWTDRLDLIKYVTEEYAKARGLDVEKTIQEVMRLKAIHNRNWHRRKGFTNKFKKR